MEWILGRVSPTLLRFSNPALVTVLSSSTVVIDSGPLSVNAGEFLYCTISASIIKGVTAGDTQFYFSWQQGTSVIVPEGAGIFIDRASPASLQIGAMTTIVFRCTQTGLMNFIRPIGTSAGSNSTINANAASLTVVRYLAG